MTSAGDYNRIKAALADNVTGSIGVGNYTVNANGEYVWTVKAVAPTETMKYAFDLRSTDNKYLKKYHEYEVIIEKVIKSASYEESNDKLIFTVVTKAGDYNRLRCGLSEGIKDNLATSSTYTVDANGDYVWTIKIPKPETDTTLYFDLRDGTTNKYLKEFLVFDYEIEA